jgi:outer membrane protein OmpA-like peptidoglycan-associated protein
MLTLLLAAAATAQVPAVPSPMMIFFDSGKREIRREWEPVIEEAAKQALAGTRLQVTGHSDRSGSAGANRRSALERAHVVADALVARGVPRSALLVAGAGEDAPFVPTEDGVREIQNRRVDITPVR